MAVKYFMVESSEAGENDPTFKAFKTELELMRALSHENLLRVYTAYIKPPTPCLVTELLAGSLDSLMWGRQSSSVTLTPAQRLRIAAGVARGVAYLHRNNVAHRDLKSGAAGSSAQPPCASPTSSLAAPR
eukprot:SAG22_NODE_246_length_13948_cov_12.055744_14_plen_130_part_00